jgi:hypothetical protein
VFSNVEIGSCKQFAQGRLIFLGLASNHDPPDLHFLEDKIAGVSHWCRAPFPILKLSGNGRYVHHITSNIQTQPKKGQG